MAIYDDGAGDAPTRPLSARQARDVCALALLILAFTGFTVAASAVDWRLGVTAASTCCLAAGIAAGIDR